jgi:hypothetical protein
MKKFCIALLSITMLLWLSACEKTVTKTVTVHDTVTVTVISVDDVMASPDSIGVGGSIQLTAQVTTEPAAGTLTYDWFADGGTFDMTEGDTVTWKAPDTEGAYTVSVHVSDGEYIGIGSVTIGVGMYAPTVSPFYKGAEACAACHSNAVMNQYPGWSETHHASAFATLMTSSHASSTCYPCHTVGYDTIPGNGGYDESPITALQNVQCESCHGPASEHVASNGTDVSSLTVSIDNSVCTGCHSGAHHPFLEDWSTTLHAASESNSHAASNAGCQPCHSGSGFVAANNAMWSFDSENPGAIACGVCHDAHSADNLHQVRTVAPVVIDDNGVTTTLQASGLGQLCVQCHHARHYGDEQVDEGDAHFGPHHSPQGDMLAGVSGYETIAQAGFTFTGKFTNHYVIEDACVTCHMNNAPNADGSSNTGHTFMPRVTACQPCHGEINDFADIMAKEDYDGDGTVEGMEDEIAGLEETLTGALVAAGLDTTGGTSVSSALSATSDDTLSDGSPDPVAVKLRKGGFNLVFVEDDGSNGFHNPTYAIQLLQQSILFMNNTALSSAHILTSDEPTIAKF